MNNLGVDEYPYIRLTDATIVEVVSCVSEGHESSSEVDRIHLAAVQVIPHDVYSAVSEGCRWS